MKTWKQFKEAIRPGGVVNDRSLEGFRTLIDQLAMETKGILDPQAKSEVNGLVTRFAADMKNTLLKYKSQNVGYSPNYQPKPQFRT